MEVHVLLQIKLAAADDLDNDVEVTSKEMQQQILAVIGKQSLPRILWLPCQGLHDKDPGP